MPLFYKKGNLLEADLDFICHQVNCQGRMGSGIAKAIKEKWPVVYDTYLAKFVNAERNFYHTYLGDIQVINVNENTSVINFFSQLTYGYDGRKYTNYEAFYHCLNYVKECCPKGSKIGFPYKIGCGLGGGNWAIIRTMIHEILAKDFEVYIYRLEEQ